MAYDSRDARALSSQVRATTQEKVRDEPPGFGRLCGGLPSAQPHAWVRDARPPLRGASERENERYDLVCQLAQRHRQLSARVLHALFRVPRELFLPEHEQRDAYQDVALPLAEEQTVSQPAMLALMLEALITSPGALALEVGAGSGYAAALLAQLVSQVWALEIRPALAVRAQHNLERVGISNVKVVLADGSEGWSAAAPYECIVVSAAATRVPPALVRQLAPGGKLVIPVGDSSQQTLMIGERPRDSHPQPAESSASPKSELDSRRGRFLGAGSARGGSWQTEEESELLDNELVWERSSPCVFVPLVTKG